MAELAIAAEPPSDRLGPAVGTERVEVIDVLRGMALFGILAANLRGFAGPGAVYMDTKLFWTAPADRIVQSVIEVFIQGKFITIFSTLFGLGFAVMFDRAAARHAGFGLIYVRRLTILMAFGLLHAFLLWFGDILMTYAAAGLILLLFARRSLRTLLRWGIALYCLPLVIFLGFVIAGWFGSAPKMPPLPTAEELARTVAVYSGGTWMEILHERVKELSPILMMTTFFLPRVVGLFLLGAWLWRIGLFRQTERFVPVLRRWMWPLFWFGVAGNAVYVALEQWGSIDLRNPNPAGLAVWTLSSAAVAALSASYGVMVLLAYRDPDWRRKLAPFGAVGRMALTNYLLQSVICTTLFYSYGLGWYGKGGPALFLIPTFLIYGLQVPWSNWWLARYRFGPLEWFWRTMTYGNAPAMRR